jgi:hypothetical protein
MRERIGEMSAAERSASAISSGLTPSEDAPERRLDVVGAAQSQALSEA